MSSSQQAFLQNPSNKLDIEAYKGYYKGSKTKEAPASTETLAAQPSSLLLEAKDPNETISASDT